jgi:hypothetical protein
MAKNAINTIQRHLLSSFNSTQSGLGMSALTGATNNSLTSIKSIDSVTTDSVLLDTTVAAIAATG